jgi:hypothetical protein
MNPLDAECTTAGESFAEFADLLTNTFGANPRST